MQEPITFTWEEEKRSLSLEVFTDSLVPFVLFFVFFLFIVFIVSALLVEETVFFLFSSSYFLSLRFIVSSVSFVSSIHSLVLFREGLRCRFFLLFRVVFSFLSLYETSSSCFLLVGLSFFSTLSFSPVLFLFEERRDFCPPIQVLPVHVHVLLVL